MSPLKWTYLRLLNAQVKICQISFANFETISWFLSKFCIPLQFHERQLLCTILAQTIYTLLKMNTLEWKFLRLSSARIKIRLNSLCQFWNDKSIPVQILHHSLLSWHITPLWILRSYVFYLDKRIHRSHNFETFKCSGENLPYSSCYFLNHKSIFLQILHHPSVSWKITPLYFSRSNIKYFAQ